MKGNKPKRNLKWLIFILILIISLTILGSGYWLYQRSIEKAVYSTTVSFMEQISSHDQLNIVYQMNNKWETLDSILKRMETVRKSRFQDIIYNLGVETQVTAFDKLYLITEDEQVYSSSYLENPLSEMTWGDVFRNTQGNFVILHSENTREQWGEYLLYGKKLSEPIFCEEKQISGVVGLVPISEITSQMHLESFNGQGIAIVMQPTGEIITASQRYGNSGSKNFLAALEEAEFFNGTSFEACKQAIQESKSIFVEYSQGGEVYYTLFQPLKNDGDNDWYLVVRVSTQVTAEQTKTLIMRSLPFFLLLGLLMFLITFLFYHNMNEARIARASEQAKSIFFANMSHEIRTPLNGIVGLQYLMRQNLDNREKLEKYLTKAEVSAEFLKSVITDVLDMSKIESGQLEIYQNEMDLLRLLEEIQLLLITQAEERELHFLVDCKQVQWPYVMGDSLRIKQVLTNLLGNALKFTEKGGRISLTVTQEYSSNIANTTFVVSDTGCGMSQEFLERIWFPFEQEQRIASQNGTGLGTTLSKTLVEKMGGSIKVESHLGEGTIFTIHIPFQIAKNVQSAKKSPDEENEWELAGKRVLIAEDNEINRMIVVSILEEHGCKLTEAVNGEEAVRAFENSPLDFYHLILMDIQMPIMDGYEATRKIRALPRKDSKKIPIFSMTANAFREDVDRALEAGMNDVVTKPLDISLLLKKIKAIKN